MGMNLLLGFSWYLPGGDVLFPVCTRAHWAAGGLAIGVIIIQGIISAIPVIGKYMPGVLLSWGINMLSGPATNYWWALGIRSRRLPPAFTSRSNSSKPGLIGNNQDSNKPKFE